MILWTIMPLELVFGQQDIEDNPYEVIEYSGLKLEIERLSSNQCRVVRILSSDPMDFLRQDVQPGRVLTYKPIYEEAFQ